MRLALLPLLMASCMPNSQVALPNYIARGENVQVQHALERMSSVMDMVGDRRGGTVDMLLAPEDGCAYTGMWEDYVPRGSWLGGDVMHLTVVCDGEAMSGSYDSDSRGVAGEIFSRLEEALANPSLRTKMWEQVVSEGDSIKRDLWLLHTDVMDTGVVDLNGNIVKEYESGYARLDFKERSVQGDPYSWQRGTDITLSVNDKFGIVDEGFMHRGTVLLSPGSGNDRVSYFMGEDMIDVNIREVRGDPVEMHKAYSLISEELSEFVVKQGLKRN